MLSSLPGYAGQFSQRFEEMKTAATPRELYTILFDRPKGGGLHNHGGLSSTAATWFDMAVKDQRS